MPERAPRLPCPVCLGTTMEKVRVGARAPVEVDHCRRCGGLWLEHGEVQGLRAVPRGDVRQRLEANPTPLVRCHDCHAPLGRDEPRCPSCGRANLLDCPDCGRTMRVEVYDDLRLDLCRGCKGVWFDHEELESIWGRSFDRALQKRNLSLQRAGGGADVAGDVLFNTLLFAPDLVFYGARAAGAAAAASADAVSRLPSALSSTPEIASSAFEAVGEAAGSVFETVVAIISGIFDNL